MIMGIPSYFSYIVKSQRSIIKKYSPSKMSWEEADKVHLTMAEVLKGAVKSIPGENV